MSNWRGKYLEGGPPRGPGHYSQDGRWWWDDTQGRWYRVTDQAEVLEIQAEDMGGTSLAASLLTTLSSQYGNGYFRFVARAHSADPRWPTYAMAGATFPGTRPSLEDVGAQGAWLQDQRERFQELHQQLLAEGWRPAGHGAHWWSASYRRPDLDWDTPADAQPTPSYLSARQAGMGGVAMHARPLRGPPGPSWPARRRWSGTRPWSGRGSCAGAPATRRPPSGSPVTRWSPDPDTRPPTPSPSTPHPAGCGRGWSSWARAAGGCTAMTGWRTCSALASAAPTGSSPSCSTFRSAIRCGWPLVTRRCRCGTRSSTYSRPRRWSLVPMATARRPWTRACPGRPGPFVLRDLGNGSSRLLVRMRSDFTPTPLGVLANKYALEPVHFAMERKMLLGIKHRAEQATAR